MKEKLTPNKIILVCQSGFEESVQAILRQLNSFQSAHRPKKVPRKSSNSSNTCGMDGMYSCHPVIHTARDASFDPQFTPDVSVFCFCSVPVVELIGSDSSPQCVYTGCGASQVRHSSGDSEPSRSNIQYYSTTIFLPDARCNSFTSVKLSDVDQKMLPEPGRIPLSSSPNLNR